MFFGELGVFFFSNKLFFFFSKPTIFGKGLIFFGILIVRIRFCKYSFFLFKGGDYLYGKH
ncbi:hypothetical protein EBI_25466 [Enterocytozoon bieneusi H348]|nr:hypothetical protein EBI_25466 [Enterocytozoon bieneusi H348]|eukprot:XP_002651201.1 hypothetical protein EBI_25466 [Enterocytozoon bieneusi H348]